MNDEDHAEPGRQNLHHRSSDREDVQHSHTSGIQWTHGFGAWEGTIPARFGEDSNGQESNPRFQASAHT